MERASQPWSNSSPSWLAESVKRRREGGKERKGGKEREEDRTDGGNEGERKGGSKGCK